MKLILAPTLDIGPFFTKPLGPTAVKEDVSENFSSKDPIFKWLEVNNRLSNLCDFGIFKLLLDSGSEDRLFKFIANSSQIELDDSDHEIYDFITKVAQRRLGEDCQLVEGRGRP